MNFFFSPSCDGLRWGKGEGICVLSKEFTIQVHAFKIRWHITHSLTYLWLFGYVFLFIGASPYLSIISSTFFSTYLHCSKIHVQFEVQM